MTASLERTTYGLGGSTVALHREGQLTPGGPYIEELYYMHGNHLVGRRGSRTGSMTLLTDEAGKIALLAGDQSCEGEAGLSGTPATLVSDVTVNHRGQMSEMARGNGVVTEYDYFGASVFATFLTSTGLVDYTTIHLSLWSSFRGSV